MSTQSILIFSGRSYRHLFRFSLFYHCQEHFKRQLFRRHQILEHFRMVYFGESNKKKKRRKNLTNYVFRTQYSKFDSSRHCSALFRQLLRIVSEYKKMYFSTEKYTTFPTNQSNTLKFSEKASKIRLNDLN